jgi:hypothetical protein
MVNVLLVAILFFNICAKVWVFHLNLLPYYHYFLAIAAFFSENGTSALKNTKGMLSAVSLLSLDKSKNCNVSQKALYIPVSFSCP